jgi:hypothetical protein
MNPCPCCSQPLLRHARQSKIYWFCPRCRQEMPNLSDVLLGHSEPLHSLNVLAPVVGDYSSGELRSKRLSQTRVLEQFV